jgi:hypothetical protein
MSKNTYTTNWKTKAKLRVLAEGNFQDRCVFITLTFNDENDFDITDISPCHKKFSLFTRRMARLFKDFKYIAVFEVQEERGAIHYHMLTNIKYIKKSKLAKIWGHGFVSINKVKKMYQVTRYLIKYMTKYAEDKRFKGRRKYFCSKNLNRSQKLGKFDAQHYLDLVRDYHLQPFSTNRYFGYNGMIAVEKYKLDELPALQGKS